MKSIDGGIPVVGDRWSANDRGLSSGHFHAHGSLLVLPVLFRGKSGGVLTLFPRDDSPATPHPSHKLGKVG